MSPKTIEQHKRMKESSKVMKQKVYIVGGGIAGLSAGIYALKSGFDVTILEAGHMAGGVCTSWRRKGYLFEGAVHWLTGSESTNPLYQLWCEVGALSPDVGVLNHDPFLTVFYEGQQVHLYRDVKKLSVHLKEIAPQDAKAIRSLCKDIKVFTKLKMPIMDEKDVRLDAKTPMKPGEILSMIPAIARMGKLAKLSLEEYAQRFSSPAIGLLLSQIVSEEFTTSSLLATLGTLARGDGGYPEGGSLGMVSRMEAKFADLGGKMKLQTKVDEVVVKNGKAIGVRCADVLHTGDAVIVTTDTLTAVDKLFATPPKDAWVQEMKSSTLPVMCTFVSIGVRCDLSSLPHYCLYPLQKPIQCAGKMINSFGFYQYAMIPNTAPEGATAMTLAFMGEHAYPFWKKAQEEGRYAQEKDALAQEVLRALQTCLPQTEDKVEVIDIATPLTYERYCDTFQGSWMSGMGKNQPMRAYPIMLEGIENLFFAGQRTQMPGGLPVAVNSARKAVQFLCRRTNTVFVGKG